MSIISALYSNEQYHIVSHDRIVFKPTTKNSWFDCKWIYVHFTISYTEPKKSKDPLVGWSLALE